ncbi:hypothetical protein FA15DRAFT_53207 [Coprinopsis marcescibilis]|uniref:Uncharacterized protein n=1 Tax=Coprinopsis marcescibilis TaxID=230819 RepID=A0A5C3KNN9_COPMA|nr:hypothetical protein FA15DRAFT_53207 [Coprinopsis marcescibilis]
MDTQIGSREVDQSGTSSDEDDNDNDSSRGRAKPSYGPGLHSTCCLRSCRIWTVNGTGTWLMRGALVRRSKNCLLINSRWRLECPAGEHPSCAYRTAQPEVNSEWNQDVQATAFCKVFDAAKNDGQGGVVDISFIDAPGPDSPVSRPPPSLHYKRRSMLSLPL